ncbi:multiple epidermal growth factor-like domains protein 10 [Ostrea edulis]|uniref:multiple epidermal growth factor-like domains protein 10 n=1 Tax=Ostrea edulis TaxID=37623 RepID=UPI0024AF9B27|nr:multiple epidermal growth factor-like domains protein 10 [Ostrea edulis]
MHNIQGSNILRKSLNFNESCTIYIMKFHDMDFLVIYSFLLCLIFSVIQATGKCNTGQIGEDKKFPCCTNYFPVEGVCKACPPGLFGNNCSVPCPHPSYGIRCMGVCKCDRSLCDVITGCPDNNIDNTTGKACPPGLFGGNCSFPCRYPYFGILCMDECKCDRSLCDVITGCPEKPTTVKGTSHKFSRTTHQHVDGSQIEKMGNIKKKVFVLRGIGHAVDGGGKLLKYYMDH